jgi:hypothetical protein
MTSSHIMWIDHKSVTSFMAEFSPDNNKNNEKNLSEIGLVSFPANVAASENCLLVCRRFFSCRFIRLRRFAVWGDAACDAHDWLDQLAWVQSNNTYDLRVWRARLQLCCCIGEKVHSIINEFNFESQSYSISILIISWTLTELCPDLNIMNPETRQNRLFIKDFKMLDTIKVRSDFWFIRTILD